MPRLFLFSLLLLFSNSIFGQSAPIPFQQLEQPPVYRGCATDSKEETIRCTQKAIERFAKQKFNTGLFKGLNLNEKRIRVYAQFIIDVSGNIKDIRVRTAYPQLEKETLRVLKLIPSLQPGIHKGTATESIYSLPLVFILG